MEIDAVKIVTIGCDPELFFRKTSGECVSVIDKLGGSKEEPKPIENGCAVQEDNVAAEFNIRPSTSLTEFRDQIKFVLRYLDKEAEGMGLNLARHVASYSFSPEQLSHWKAMVFGCEPDLSVWDRKENPKPESLDPMLRSCGGHIHVGTDLDPFELGKSMDLHLAIPSLSLDPDTRRRELYGKAGAIRIKPYGMEYRTLSNFWIWADHLIEWAWEGTNKAVEFVEKGYRVPDTIGKHIQNAVNTGNRNSLNVCYQYLSDTYGTDFAKA